MDVVTRGPLHAWLQSATNSDMWNHFKIRELPPSNGGQHRLQNLESIQDLRAPLSNGGWNRFQDLESIQDSRAPSPGGRDLSNSELILNSRVPHIPAQGVRGRVLPEPEWPVGGALEFRIDSEFERSLPPGEGSLEFGLEGRRSRVGLPNLESIQDSGIDALLRSREGLPNLESMQDSGIDTSLGSREGL